MVANQTVWAGLYQPTRKSQSGQCRFSRLPGGNYRPDRIKALGASVVIVSHDLPRSAEDGTSPGSDGSANALPPDGLLVVPVR